MWGPVDKWQRRGGKHINGCPAWYMNNLVPTFVSLSHHEACECMWKWRGATQSLTCISPYRHRSPTLKRHISCRSTYLQACAGKREDAVLRRERARCTSSCHMDQYFEHRARNRVFQVINRRLIDDNNGNHPVSCASTCTFVALQLTRPVERCRNPRHTGS